MVIQRAARSSRSTFRSKVTTSQYHGKSVTIVDDERPLTMPDLNDTEPAQQIRRLRPNSLFHSGMSLERS